MASKQITKNNSADRSVMCVCVCNFNEQLHPYIKITFNTADCLDRIYSKLHSFSVAVVVSSVFKTQRQMFLMLNRCSTPPTSPLLQ